MPHNLDAQTRRVIANVTCSLLIVSCIFIAHTQMLILPRLKARIAAADSSYKPEKWPSFLFLGTVATIALQIALSALLTAPIIITGKADRNAARDPVSSSINFCEEDFADALRIAEPANTASSVACYIPLALLGLFGPASRQWSRRTDGNRRFAVAYGTLLAIGVGSTLLHALLTAGAQGGDELPMLWFTAATSYCALDIIIEGIQRGGNRLGLLGKFLLMQRSRLRTSLAASAVIVTAIYCLSRDSFLPFYIMFSTYSWLSLIGVISITCFINWNNAPGGARRADKFVAHVLIPFAVCSGIIGALAIVSWVSEMLFCLDVTQNKIFGDTVAPWIWNRAVHPLWHTFSGLLAWLLVQVLLAAHGMQHGWGEPTVRWCWAPYVAFESAPPTKSKHT